MEALSQRTGPASPRRAEVEARVLRATEELLDTGAAYGDLKVEQIATAAGISRPAFYFYFRDKRELLMRLTEDVVGLLYREAEGWWSLDDDSQDRVEALRTATHRVVTLYADHAVLLRAVADAAAYDPVIAEFWRAAIQRFTEATRARIIAEQADGHMRDLPAEEVAFALTWMVERACYQRLAVSGEPLDEAFVDGLAAIWTRTLYSD
jgi:AcrR family transcriptional regulator